MERIKNLKKEIIKYSKEYYLFGKSGITDLEFDNKLSLLKKLEKNKKIFDKNSPTNKIYDIILRRFDTIKHKYKMYSLNNIYNYEEIYKWIKEKRNKKFTCEQKYDGVSISLLYKNNKLIYGITRGNGEIGNNITNNIIHINSIPSKINLNIGTSVIIRGEIIMNYNTFKCINLLNNNKYTNPRHAVIGLLISKKPNKKFLNKLICFGYSIITDNNLIKSQYDILLKLKKINFSVPYFIKTNSVNEILNYYKYLMYNKCKLSYEIDGIVVKVNSIKEQKKLGYTNKYPKWSIAIKFDSCIKETFINEIKYTVGKTGKISCILHVKSTYISGTYINKLLLCNINDILKLNLYKGKKILIKKSGNIIPQLVYSYKYTLNKKFKKKKIINNCPGCKKKIIIKNKSYYCINNYCKDINICKIIHFTSKLAMDIHGLGNMTIKNLFKLGILRNISDIYSIKKYYKNTNSIKINKIIYEIERSLNRPFYCMIYGLSIPHVGISISKIISNYISNLNELINIDNKIKILRNINCIGSVIIKNIINYINNDYNIKILNKLKNYNFTYPKI